MSPTEFPLNLIRPEDLQPGYEATSITEFGENDRALVKEVDPLDFHLPDAIRQQAEKITDPTQRAVFVAKYKKDQYEKLKQVFGEHLAQTDYIVYKSRNGIVVGVIQPKIDGETIHQLERKKRVTDEIVKALQKFFDLITKAQTNPELSKDAALAGFVPRARDLIDRTYVVPRGMPLPDLCGPLNLIYQEDKKRIVAVDW